jgi:hypothetical protein
MLSPHKRDCALCQKAAPAISQVDLLVSVSGGGTTAYIKDSGGFNFLIIRMRQSEGRATLAQEQWTWRVSPQEPLITN